MVDDNFNTWLIEVNSSPAMDYSTKVTTRLVKMVLKDTAKVIVDWREAPRKVYFLFYLEKKKKLILDNFNSLNKDNILIINNNK